jgi:hypothetical protein
VQQAAQEHEAMFAAEQDFMMLDPTSGLPLGFLNSLEANPPQQQPFFCGAGAHPERVLCPPPPPTPCTKGKCHAQGQRLSARPQTARQQSAHQHPLPRPSRAGHGVAAGRKVAESHLQACLSAGIKLGGYHAGAAAGVWSYQLGPCRGIDFADQLWASRYLLLRASEGGGVGVSFDRRHPDTAIHLGCRVNFSTRDTRDTAIGLMALQQQVARLEASHAQHMAVYSGSSCGSPPEPFSCSKGGKSSVGSMHAAPVGALPGPGRALRGSFLALRWPRPAGAGTALVRAWLPCAPQGPCPDACLAPPPPPPNQVTIPTKTVMQKAGHLVDNRPSASMDPYLVSALLLATCLGMPLPMAPASAPQAQQQRSAPACAPIPIPIPMARAQQAPRPIGLPMQQARRPASPQDSFRSGPLSSRPSSIPTPGVSTLHPAAVVSFSTMQQLAALQMQQRLPSQPRRCVSPGPSCSWNSGDSAGSGGCSTLDSRDVLIDELQKFDKLSPGTPPYNLTLSHAVECSDESSDGTSPETRAGPLACAARSEVMW